MQAAAAQIARQHMVDSQLRTNKVTDERVLEAFLSVPREAFLPAAAAGLAYIDEDAVLAAGRVMLEPMVLARLVQAAELTADSMVLEIAAGSGYGTAILGRIAGTVVSVESEPSLVAHARSMLAAQGVANAVVTEGEIAEGFAAQAPYDAIFIHGAVQDVPPALVRQLRPGGKLLAVRREDGPVPGQAVMFQLLHGTLSPRVLFDASTPLLPEFRRQPAFTF